MSKKSDKKPGQIQVFWTKHFENKKKVTNDECTDALIKLLKEKAGDEKDDNKKEDESRRQFASLVASRVFWPVEEKDSGTSTIVTKASILFACKNSTFGNWQTLFPTIAENFDAPDMPLPQLQCFFGRADFESQIKSKLKESGDYCLRFHDEGGFELCYCRKMHGNTVPVQERIIRRNLKNKPIFWQWSESVARIGGKKTVLHNFDSVNSFIKTMKDKKLIKNPIVSSAYKTLLNQGSGKTKGRIDEIMDSIPPSS